MPGQCGVPPVEHREQRHVFSEHEQWIHINLKPNHFLSEWPRYESFNKIHIYFKGWLETCYGDLNSEICISWKWRTAVRERENKAQQNQPDFSMVVFYKTLTLHDRIISLPSETYAFLSRKNHLPQPSFNKLSNVSLNIQTSLLPLKPLTCDLHQLWAEKLVAVHAF